MFNIFPVASEEVLHKNLCPILMSSEYEVIEGHDDSVKKISHNPLFARFKTLLAVN